MKAEYDKETDALTITLRDARVKEGDEIRPGVIADFGYDGGVIGFEILQASKIVERAGEMQFAVAVRSLSSFTSAPQRPVFGSADHSGADRTSDRAGAARELAGHLQPVRHDSAASG